MNIHFENGIPIGHCHECHCDRELFEMIRKGNDIVSGCCGAHLGFIWDLPAQYLAYLIGG